MTEEEYKDPTLLICRLNLFVCPPVGRLDEWMVRQNIGEPFFGKTLQDACRKAAKTLDDPAYGL